MLLSGYSSSILCINVEHGVCGRTVVEHYVVKHIQ